MTAKLEWCSGGPTSWVYSQLNCLLPLVGPESSRKVAADRKAA